MDDSALERERSRGELAKRFEVTAYADGAAMLEALAQGAAPDLLVLDWEMPDMSGREVCAFVRERESASHLPILILSASAEALVGGLEVGANDYVLKPFRPEELNARVANLVALRRAHAQLVDAEQLLRTEGAVRERFIGILGHDLRQPLNTIVFSSSPLAAAAAAGAGDTSRDARVLRAALRMGRMIEEILDFTRARVGGGIPVTRSHCKLIDVVRRAVDERSERLSIIVTTEGDTSGQWDADRMAQVFGNLLGNAFEHGAPGRPVNVHVWRSAAAVEFEVQNEGTPITSEEQRSLFDPFRRGSPTSASATKSSGLGLGLFISDQIVRGHGGAMTVRSDAHGTTFAASVPHAPDRA